MSEKETEKEKEQPTAKAHAKQTEEVDRYKVEQDYKNEKHGLEKKKAITRTSKRKRQR